MSTSLEVLLAHLLLVDVPALRMLLEGPGLLRRNLYMTVLE